MEKWGFLLFFIDLIMFLSPRFFPIPYFSTGRAGLEKKYPDQ